MGISNYKKKKKQKASRRRTIVKGITRRWLFNTMGAVSTLLAIIWLVTAFLVHLYFYNSLSSHMEKVVKLYSSGFANIYSSQGMRFKAAADIFVSDFIYSENIELTVYSKDGTAASRNNDLYIGPGSASQDLISSVAAGNGFAQWTEVDKASGDKLMISATSLTDAGGNTIGYAQYVASTAYIDSMIFRYVVTSGAVSLGIILFVVISGLFFINSIVVPVREVGATARKIASGDFDTRIEKKYDDEIGELCDTINNMAGELATTDHIKNEFISSVSHELRTPLTAIQGWGETILSSGPYDQATVKKGMSVIIDETERLSSMVEELLDFSRMQDGKFRLVMDKIDILAELGEAVLMFSDRAHREGLTFIYNEPESLPPVMGDRNRLKQVFVNVLDNAFKYSEKGGIVAVSTADYNDHIRILVSDTGCGISARDLPRVKEKFFKGNSTRRGSGIGLAVADEIICLHGGTLELSSEEGKGTTVSITLPTVIM